MKKCNSKFFKKFGNKNEPRNSKFFVGLRRQVKITEERSSNMKKRKKVRQFLFDIYCLKTITPETPELRSPSIWEKLEILQLLIMSLHFKSNGL
jgi:hypothetical protein